MLLCQGGLVPKLSHGSPMLVDTVVRPRRTCPGVCRPQPDYSGMLPCLGGPLQLLLKWKRRSMRTPRRFEKRHYHLNTKMPYLEGLGEGLGSWYPFGAN